MRLQFLLLFCLLQSADAGIRVAVISDVNNSYGSTSYDPRVARAVARIIGLKPDVVICTGDMIAGQRPGKPLAAAKAAVMWSAFHRVVTEPLLRSAIPLAVTPGNHDASAFSAFERERVIFAAQWRDRKPAVPFVDAAGYPFDYAFQLNGVLFVALAIDDRLRNAARPRRNQPLPERPRSRVLFGMLAWSPLCEPGRAGGRAEKARRLVGAITGLVYDARLQ